MRWLFLFVCAALLLPGGVVLGLWTGQADAQDRSERIGFAPRYSSRTVRDTISGYEGSDDLIHVPAGQRFAATLRTSNPNSHLNIMAQDASEALFGDSSPRATL